MSQQFLDQGQEQEETSAPFTREFRYLVFKIKDLPRSITPNQLADLLHLYRLVGMKKKIVVVEEDWPEYEKVWAMIEERMKNAL